MNCILQAYIHAMHGPTSLSLTFPSTFVCSVKSPVRSASKAVGMQARRQLKLAFILAEVHSEIIHNKTKGRYEEYIIATCIKMIVFCGMVSCMFMFVQVKRKSVL